MKRLFPDAIAMTIIAVVLVVFFLPLFWPEPKLLVTPDFGGSDSWNSSFSAKYILSERLKVNQIPLWVKELGSGHPMYADGHVGTFFFTNILLYKYFDLITAYNLSYLIIIVIFGWGMYCWLRTAHYSLLSSFYAGITSSFSAVVMTQLTHVVLLPGLAMIPWALLFALKLAEKATLRRISLLAIVFSQQLFSGHPQYLMISLLFTTAYYLSLIYKEKNKIALRILRFLGIIILATGLSAIQLLPSYEYLTHSTVSEGFSPENAMYYSYPLKHLMTFFNPFLLGNPRFGTYPHFANFDGSIFWENSGYIGFVPVLLLLSFPFIAKKYHKGYNIGFFIIILGMSFLLMLGKYSPLYFVYSFWPLSVFRVPSRFIIVFVLSLVYITSFIFEQMQKKFTFTYEVTIVMIIVIGINTFQLATLWNGYHAIVPAKTWLSKPEVLSILHSSERIMTIDAALAYNRIYLKKGWSDIAPYRFLRNTLMPNSNVIWNVPQVNVYASRPLYRSSVAQALIDKEIVSDTKVATVSAQGEKLLNLFSVQSIISASPINSKSLINKKKFYDEMTTIQVYNNPNSLPRAYLATSVQIAKTANRALVTLQSDDFILGKSVLLEQPISIKSPKNQGIVTVKDITSTHVAVYVNNNETERVLVLTDTYYPGWKATIDGVITPIMPANIKQRAVVVPAGSHTVDFIFEPASVRQGAILSVASLVITLLFILL